MHAKVIVHSTAAADVRDEVGTLVVHLVECKDLRGVDKGGTSDPYVKLTLGKKTQKSRTIKATNSPVFDQDFTFAINNEKRLEVAVFDDDRFKDDKLGTSYLALDDLVHDEAEARVLCCCCLGSLGEARRGAWVVGGR